MRLFFPGRRSLFAIIGIHLASAHAIVAATGGIDSSFTAAVGGNDVQAIALQADGMILVGGRITTVDSAPRQGLVRLFPDGSADLSFNCTYRWFITNYAGSSPESMRFHPDGSVDSSFQMPPGGYALDFALLPDGKVLVAGGFWIGDSYHRLLRLDPDGSLDDSFTLEADISVNALEVLDDGRVLVGGGFTEIGGWSQAHLARLNADGTLDTTFAPSPGNWVETIAVQEDGQILVATGTTTGTRLIQRFAGDGTADAGFSVSVRGNATTYVNNLVIQADGKVLFSGTFNTVSGAPRDGIARLLPTGQVDPFFVVPGASDAENGPLVLQSDGKVLLGGRFSYWANVPVRKLMRLENDSASSSMVLGTNSVEWQSSGTSPLIGRIAFERYDDTIGQWTPFGAPVRIPGGWSADTSGLPFAGVIRATGIAVSDLHCQVALRKMISYGGMQPAMAVDDPGESQLTHGATVDVGNAVAGYSRSLPFSVRNAGTGALDEIAFSLSGPNASEFAVIHWAPAPVGPDESIPFSIRYSPSALGASAATLTISSNAPGGPFVLNLTGTGSNTLNPHFGSPGDVPLRTGEFDSQDTAFGILSLGFAPEPGTVLTAIDQFHGIAPPLGLADLADGDILTAAFGAQTYEFLAGFQGNSPFTGDSNDLILTLIGPGCPRSDYVTPTGTDATALAVSNSGRMMYFDSGESKADLARADGTLLDSFTPVLSRNGGSGYFQKVLACPDGAFLVSGSFDTVNGSPRNSLAKFDDDGNLVAGFVPDIGTEMVTALAVQSDGKILVGGGDTYDSVQRLNADGSKDSGFSVTTDSGASLLAPLANDQILMGGPYFEVVNGVAATDLVRLNPDGSLDSSFNFTSENGSGFVGRVAEQSDGKVVIEDSAGSSAARLRRILPDGSMDPEFEPDFGDNAGADFDGLAIQTDGKILVGGHFAEANGEFRTFVVRLHPDGSLDPGFVNNGLWANLLVLQRDGEILTHGGIIAGVFRTGLVKLLNDPALLTLEHPDAPTVRLLIGGSAPEFRSVSFDVLASGAPEWAPLAAPTRTPVGWELSGAALPAAGIIRSRAIPSGQSSSSSVIQDFLMYGSAVPEIVFYDPYGSELGSGDSYDLGPVLTGYTRTVDFRVTNHGDGFWENLDVSFSGTDAGDFSLVSMPDYGLLPGETGVFRVTFAPSVAGPRTATLVLGGNDPVNNPLSITLAGNGGDILSPTYLNADEVPLRNDGFDATGRQFGTLTLGFAPSPGVRLLAVDNTGSLAIESEFADLPDGSAVSATFDGVAYDFLAGYQGGDGNDLVLILLGPGVVDPSFPAVMLDGPSDSLFISLPLEDGGTLLAGYFDELQGFPIENLARLRADGSVDPSFSPNPNRQVLTAHRFEDGSMLIAGSFTKVGDSSRSYIARLHPDGSLDKQFIPYADRTIRDLKVQPDGKILVGGEFRKINGVTRNRIARLNANGSLDSGFDPDASSGVRAIALQPDGKILIGGSFSSVGGQARVRLARLESDGSVDSSFAPTLGGASVNSQVDAIHVQSDDKILIGSTFTTINGDPSEHICRLETSGETDLSFLGGANAPVTAIMRQVDGKILIGGDFQEVHGSERNQLARLLPDGSTDELFTPDLYAGWISQIAIRSSGTLDVAGHRLSRASGAVRNGHARLLNDEPISTFSAPSPGTLHWMPGGSFPEVSAVRFEIYDPAPGSWVPLGQADRVSATWELGGLSLPPAAACRARVDITNGVASYRQVTRSGVIGSGPPVLGVRHPRGTLLGSAHLAFGAIPSSWSSDQELKLSNDGLADLEPIVISVTGPQADDFSIVSPPVVTLEPGESSTLTIRFTPSGTGVRQADLTISSNDPVANPLIIPLEGNAGSAFSPIFQSADDVPVTGDTFDLSGTTFGGLQLDFAPEPGTVLLAIEQTGTSAFAGTLAGLPDQGSISATHGGQNYPFAVTYRGGSQNDLSFVLMGADTPDPAFQVSTNSTVYSMACLADDSTLVAGAFSECNGIPAQRIARIRPDGSLDPSFRVALTSWAPSMAVQRNSGVLVAGTLQAPDGTIRSRLARISPDGTLDPGSFSSVDGVTKTSLALLHADGSLDASFTTSLSGNFRTVRALAEQTNGKLLIGGAFSALNGTTRELLARLDPSGVLDESFGTSFNGSSSNSTGVTCLLCQPDSRILVSGHLTVAGTPSLLFLTRLEENGDRDPGFNPIADTYPKTMLLQRDGKLVVGGAFTTVNGSTRAGFARILPDGTLDAGFHPNPLRSGTPTVNCLAEDPGGHLLAGGVFNSMNGLGGSNFARLTPALGAVDPVFVDSSSIAWERPASLAELADVWFEVSTDSGAHWTPLGPATRTATGWEITSLSLPASGHVRALGIVAASNEGSTLTSRNIRFGRVPTALEAWREIWFGSELNHGLAADSWDADIDGLANLLEFALGLNPLDRGDNRMPEWSRAGEAYELEFERPANVDGITCSAEWSETLGDGDWYPAEDLSSGSTHRFRVPMDGRPKLFFRLKVANP